MKRVFIATSLFCLSIQSYAVSPDGQRDINQIASGNMSSIRNAAKYIYRRGETDTTVLDALAEAMLQNYKKPDRTAQDAIAWSCKALGVSGNGRYQSVLQTIIKQGPSAKTGKYCSAASDSLPKATAVQYKQGVSSVKQPSASSKPQVSKGSLSAVGQQNIDQMVNGGASSLRSAAKSIYRRSEQNTKVLDVLAEVMLQNYQSGDGTAQDAVAWGCKALSRSNNSRYYQTLKTISEKGSSKVQGHCSKALGMLPKPEGNQSQYSKGAKSLQPLKAQAQEHQAEKAANVVAVSGKEPITAVKEGMSMSEVYTLIGEPTSTNRHVTGKAWRPFNFRGDDLQRTNAFYKGQGRLVFSQHSRYNSTWYVKEVHINPNESGYP